MEFRKISDYIPYIEDTYYISEYGDIFWRCKSYNGSWKVNIRTEDGNKQLCTTSLIKPYLNSDITIQVHKDIWVINGYSYARRYLTAEDNGYYRVHLYEANSKKRHRFSIHKLVNLVFNGVDLSLATHHIDCDKSNNHYSNLQGLTLSEHRKLHIRMLNE